jgi:peptide/nickel transport system substrate-binding protein
MTEADTLTILLSADPAGLDPIQLQGVQNWAEGVAVSAIYDQLFFIDSDNNLCSRIGTSIRSLDGGESWILKLREGVRFSDDAPFDAAAVQFNWQRIAESPMAPARKQAALIQEMVIADASTLHVRLRSPAPQWDRVVARSLSSIGSPEAIRCNPEGFAAAPVGAGPFQLGEWKRGSHMRLVRNPRYWQPGKPRAEEILVLTGMPDADSKFAAMQDGRAQVALEPMGPNIARYRAQRNRFNLCTTPDSGGGVALIMNVERTPFDDVRVRRALSLALDSAAFVDAAGYCEDDAVMTSLDRAGSLYHDPLIHLPQTDAAEAQALIDAAAAERGGPIAFVLQTFTNEGHLKEAHAIKRLLEARLKNVAVDVTAGSVAELAAKWRTGDYQASNYAVQWSEPALDLPAHYASNSPLNFTRYRDDQLDAALDQLTRAVGCSEMIDAHHRVLRQLLDDVPLIWLSHKMAYHVVDRSVQGWTLAYSLRPLLDEARRMGGGAEA